MTVVLVRNTKTYEAIQATDPEADTVLRRWFEDVHPGEDSSDVAVPHLAREQGLWFLRAGVGELIALHPADFAGDFETIEGIDDSMAQFEAMLKETAKVEETVNVDGLTPQQIIDNYIREKVALMLNEFEELEEALADADDEEDTASALAALEQAQEAFNRVFGVKKTE